MSNFSKNFLIIISGLLIGISISFAPKITRTINNWEHNIKKADDETNYETIKQVEDTCRSMIASYNSDKLKYEQYKESEDKQERSWGEQAKMRANTTASTYNNYIIKNSYIWKNNVPSDIYMTLEYLE